MLTINNIIKDTNYDGVSFKKLSSNTASETILVSMEKGAEVPRHVADKDAQLIMLEGKIEFHIEDQIHELKDHQVLNFKANVIHWVAALINSKFLIIK